MSLSRSEVVDAVKRCLDAVRQWESADAPNVHWHGQSVKQLSQAAETAIDDLCELCRVTEVDDDAKEIILAIDRVQQEFWAWAQAVDVSPESVHPSGTPELRTAIRLLPQAIQAPEVRQPENIRELMDAGTPDEQICRIYGFLKDDGSPDMLKLSEEKRTPGTHYDPKTWQPPWLIRRLREAIEAWDQRAYIGHERVGRHVVKPRSVATESLDDLIAQGVTAEQISVMKNMTIADIEEYAARHNMPIAGRTIRRPILGSDQAEELAVRRSELYPHSHPDVSDMEDRILACALDEMKPVDIAEALRLDYPDLTWQKVNAILRRLEKEGAEDKEPVTA